MPLPFGLSANTSSGRRRLRALQEFPEIFETTGDPFEASNALLLSGIRRRMRMQQAFNPFNQQQAGLGQSLLSRNPRGFVTDPDLLNKQGGGF